MYKLYIVHRAVKTYMGRIISNLYKHISDDRRYSIYMSLHVHVNRDLVRKSKETKPNAFTKSATKLDLIRNLLRRHNGWLTKLRRQVLNSEPGHMPNHLHT